MSHTRPRRSRAFSHAPRIKRLRLETLESRDLLTVTFTVNSTGDEDLAHVGSGIVTLRSAIEQANLDISGDDIEINFSIAGSGPFVIHPGSDTNHTGVPLPIIIRDEVTIDGQSQSGIVVDGSQAAFGSEGLAITASDCVIVGLAIQDFTGTGVLIASTASVEASDNRIEDNIITGNGVGVAIDDFASTGLDQLYFEQFGLPVAGQLIDASDATGNVIVDNTISGNTSRGVFISHASMNFVDNNTITGTTAGPGIEILGVGDAERDVTTDSNNNLIEVLTIHNDATRNEITSNTITDNHGDGVLVHGASYNSIGLPGQGNVISGNVGNEDGTGNGIAIKGTATLASEPEEFAALVSSPVAEMFLAEFAQTWSLPLGDTQLLSLTSIEYNVHWVGGVLSGVPTFNFIQGNKIGTDSTGRSVDGNTLDGILIDTAARVTMIGDTDIETLQANPGVLTSAANVIGGNNRNGITIRGAALYDDPIDHVQAAIDTVGGPFYGNHIGGDLGGTPATFTMANQDFENNAAIFEGVPTLVAGNSIGVFSDSQGVYAIGNTDDGVLIEHSRALVYFNAVSANGDNGIHLTGTPQTAMIFDSDDGTLYSRSYLSSIVSGNRIGIDITGLFLEDNSDETLGNGAHGVFIENGAQYNFIGPTGEDEVDPYVTAQAQRNIISNNVGWGVYVHGMGAFHFEGSPSEQFSDPFAYPDFVEENPEGPEEFLKQPYGTNANQIAGNYIGVNASGSGAAGNGMGGVLIDNAAAYTFVGSIAAPLAQQWGGNVISANDGPGVEITGRGTAVNVVGGNLIGLSADGETGMGNNGPGVWIHDQPVATNIGGDVYNANLGSRNYIADNNGPGLLIEGVYDLARAVIDGVTAGTPDQPLNNLANEEAWGAAFDSGTNYYETAITSNWIGLGVEFETSNPETGYVTRVGFTPKPLGNHGDGIKIVDSSNTDIGGAHPGWTKNTIAANDGHGVYISGDRSFLNFVKQAHIGTDPSGTSASNSYGLFANGGDGIRIDDGAHHNMIDGTGMGVDFFSVQLIPSIEHGGNGTVDLESLRGSFDVADSGVVISNNDCNGIAIDGSDWNQIGGGTYIGTNLGGTAALGNTLSGVLITGGATSNHIGPRGARTEQHITYDENENIVPGDLWFEVVVPTVISGNLGAGVRIEETGTNDNRLLGAVIGATGEEYDFASGPPAVTRAPLGNIGPGVLIASGANSNVIDTTNPLLIAHEQGGFEFVEIRSIIVANGTVEAPRAGIEITGAGTEFNEVKNSYIGTNELGATNLGNTGDGVLITSGASGNTIGDVGAGNVIARNGTAALEPLNTATFAGVAIKGTATTENVVEGNTIADNRGAGVFINEAADNQILANIIDDNDTHGVEVVGIAENNTIGGAGSGDGNEITSNGGSGVYLHGNSLEITHWGIDAYGYLTLTLNPLDGVYVGQHLVISGFALLDGDEIPFAVTEATVVSIDVSTSTIVTDFEVPEGTDPEQVVQSALVTIEAPEENTVRGNLIGTNASNATNRGNLDGIQLSAATNNTIADNTITYNLHHGVRLEQGSQGNIIGGSSEADRNFIKHNGAALTTGWAGIYVTTAAQANQINNATIEQNTGDGVRFVNAGGNTVSGCEISENTANGIANGGEGSKFNVILGSTIEANQGHGVLISDGAEGTGVGVSMVASTANGAEGYAIATDPSAGNTIEANEGNQVYIGVTTQHFHTRYNFVSGFNSIVASTGQDAIVIDGAFANIIGNGGEGQDPNGGGYVVGSNTPAHENGNVIGYSGTNYGVVVNQVNANNVGGDGSEGNAILGNAFVGDLDNAISVSTGFDINPAPPSIGNVTVTDEGGGVFDLDIETTVSGAGSGTDQHVRVDYYLVNPNNLAETRVLGSKIFDGSAAATFEANDINVGNIHLTDLDGWYVTATATYWLQQTNQQDNPDALRERSITSTLEVAVIA